MCEFASFVLTKDNAFWLSDSDSHEEIIHYYSLQNLDKDPIGMVRVEISPPKTSADNLDSWKFKVDQDVYPSWTCQGDPSLEIRTREALSRRAVEEKWFEVVTGQHVMSGKFGTASAGDNGRASAGKYGKATAGDHGNATAGDYGTATAGIWGTASADNNGRAFAGDNGRAFAGDNGRAFAGDFGKATAGYDGTAIAGTYGTASAGNLGIVSAGKYGTIIVQWFDQASRKRRTLVGYIGEEGLEPNTKYRVEGGAWVKVG